MWVRLKSPKTLGRSVKIIIKKANGGLKKENAMKSIIDAINKRVSVRSYADRPIDNEKKQELIHLLDSANTGPFGHKVRFALVDLSEMDKNQIRSLGTYGFISGAKSFIVSAIKDGLGEIGGARALVDLGYCFEKVILAATNLGLGTCWLGGTFKRVNFAASVNAAEDEIVPAISPIGYPRGSRTIREMTVRRFANSDQRKPWEELFFDRNLKTPLSKESAGVYAVPLECVRLGPSASNNQPWRVVYQKPQGAFHFYLKRTFGYNKLNGKIDLQLIDMGIAMCHFELSAREKGLAGTWEMAKPDLDMGDAEYISTWKQS
jgi:nitroreductase